MPMDPDNLIDFIASLLVIGFILLLLYGLGVLK